jgi:hypothetical protein
MRIPISFYSYVMYVDEILYTPEKIVNDLNIYIYLLSKKKKKEKKEKK